jgi:hypothetical protein
MNHSVKAQHKGEQKEKFTNRLHIFKRFKG